MEEPHKGKRENRCLKSDPGKQRSGRKKLVKLAMSSEQGPLHIPLKHHPAKRNTL